MAEEESLIMNLRETTHKYKEVGSKAANLGKLIQNNFPVPFVYKEGNKSILVQSMGNYELDGITEGYGAFETLRRVKN